MESVPTEGKELEPRKGLILTGSAAYKKDKLVGFLNEDETIGLNILLGNRKSAAVHVTSPANDEKNISIEITKTKCDMEPFIGTEGISYNITVKAEGNITEVQDNIDITSLEQFDKVNARLTESINNNLCKTVSKIHDELKTDILGFGSAFQRKYPKEWEKIKDRWDIEFAKTTYTIKVETSLKRTGLLLKPINAQKAEK